MPDYNSRVTGQKRKQLTAAQWFGRADQFWAAADAIGARAEGIFVPNVICRAFASEAFLKCLLTVRQKHFPADHNLERLFDLLPTADKRAIEEAWNARSLHRLDNVRTDAPRSFVDSLPRTFRQSLKRGADAFKDWRYDPGGEGRPRFFMLDGFALRVRDVIVEAHPDWLDDPPDWSGKQSKDQDQKSGSAGVPAGSRWREGLAGAARVSRPDPNDLLPF